MTEIPPTGPGQEALLRAALLRSAVELLCLQPWDFVTVQDIAAQAGLAPTVFRRYFKSRELLLAEIMQTFATRWIDTATQGFGAARTPDDLCATTSALMRFLATCESEARIFFLSSIGAPSSVEEIRADSHRQLVYAAIEAVRRIAPQRSTSDAQVSGVALVALYELAARSQVGMDEPFRVLGPMGFHDELTGMTRIAAGFAA